MAWATSAWFNDMTSGFNIAKNISDLPDFQDLCGFAESDVRRMLSGVIAAQGLSLDPDFLSELAPPDRYPRRLLDPNVRTDAGRLARALLP